MPASPRLDLETKDSIIHYDFIRYGPLVGCLFQVGGNTGRGAQVAPRRLGRWTIWVSVHASRWRSLTRAFVLILAAGPFYLGCRPSGPRLELTVVDAATGRPTPARVEVLDDQGLPQIAPDALRVAGDCGWLPVHNWIGWWARLQMWRALETEVENPFTGTVQFYVDRPVTLDLEPGFYRIRVFKGPEYRVAFAEVGIRPGQRAELTVPLERWIDLPGEGWYSADDHLHIARPHPRFDRRIARWMQAEDLHVANLLQMGLAQGLHITPQHRFGDRAVYRDGDTLLASGQENPRTHVLGHAITLGAADWLDRPDDYLAYDRLWRRAHESGGVNGYAHWGLGGADEGLATWAPEQLLDFLEVLGFNVPHYALWYDLLNLGLAMTPTAGTDYPCLPSLPGRDRFYTRLDGPLDYRSWIEAVRSGRTFVTNGPVLALRVGGAGIGDRLELDAPRELAVEGRVRYDPQRDDVTRLELVRAGQVVASASVPHAPGEIRLQTTLQADRATWVALRAAGIKMGETPITGIELLESALDHLPRATTHELLHGPGRTLPRDGDPRPAAAHTAPIYLTVTGSPPLAAQPSARAAAARLLALLDELEARFADDRIADMAGFPGRGDGVGLEDLEAGRAGLLASIDRARRYYGGLLESDRQ